MPRRINIDLTHEEEMDSFPPWLADVDAPPGMYGGQIYRVEDGTDKNNEILLSIWWKVLFGPLFHPLQNQFNGMLVSQRLSFHPKVRGRIKHFLHVIGENYQGQIVIDLDHWINKRAKLKVTAGIPEGFTKTFWQVEDFFEWDKACDGFAAQLPTAATAPIPTRTDNKTHYGPAEPDPNPDKNTGWDDDIPF
jgi:hypothetical protein